MAPNPKPTKHLGTERISTRTCLPRVLALIAAFAMEGLPALPLEVQSISCVLGTV